MTTLQDEDLGATDSTAATADGNGLSLREAIRIANENGGGANQGEPNGDMILFDGNLAGGQIDLNQNLGQLFISDDLNIDGTDQDNSNGDQGRITISAGGNHRVIEVVIGAGGVDLNGLIITGGDAQGMGGQGTSVLGAGGGILVQGPGTVRLGNTILSNNTGTFGGGAAIFGGGEFKLDFSTVQGNTATPFGTLSGGAGGGLFIDSGLVSIQAGAFVIDNRAIGGTGQLAGGGGIYNQADSMLTVNESSIYGNVTDTVGGGIANFGNAIIQSGTNIGDGIESDEVEDGNQARDGGGLYNAANAVLTLMGRVEVASNTATGDGGGILNRGVLTISETSITGNSALGSGGGIENISESGIATSGQLSLINVTISSNIAGVGGGLDLNALATNVEIRHTTIAENRSTINGAGGIHRQNGNAGRVLLFSTLVANNIADQGTSPDVFGLFSPQSQFNLVGNATGASGLVGLFIGTATMPRNPRISPLANNGGNTRTHALLPDSVAIQQGGRDAQTPDTDQRISLDDDLFVRDYGGINASDRIVDIGAYELQGIDERKNDIFVTAPNPGAGTDVTVFNQFTGSPSTFANVYPNFQGGVRTATGDVNGDGVPDIIAAPGVGGGPHIRIFDGMNQTEIRSFFAFDSAFIGGVYVAAGDVNNDGFADIIAGADSGGGPHVRVFDGRFDNRLLPPNILFEFFAYAAQFTGGVRVAAGDISGDGLPDIILAPGPGGGPHIRVFNSQTRSFIDTAQRSFFAYSPNFTGGVFVSAADFNGDGQIDIITTPGAGGGPHVKVFNGANGGELASFFAYPPNNTSGLRVAAGDTTADGMADIVTTDGEETRIFDAEMLMENPASPEQAQIQFPGENSRNGSINALAELRSMLRSRFAVSQAQSDFVTQSASNEPEAAQSTPNPNFNVAGDVESNDPSEVDDHSTPASNRLEFGVILGPGPNTNGPEVDPAEGVLLAQKITETPDFLVLPRHHSQNTSELIFPLFANQDWPQAIARELFDGLPGELDFGYLDAVFSDLASLDSFA